MANRLDNISTSLSSRSASTLANAVASAAKIWWAPDNGQSLPEVFAAAVVGSNGAFITWAKDISSITIDDDFALMAAAEDVIWRATSSDCEKFDLTPNTQALRGDPLWPHRPMRSWRDTSIAFEHVFDDYNEEDNWKLWLRYHSYLVGGRHVFDLDPLASSQIEYRISTGDGRQDFWDREPGAGHPSGGFRNLRRGGDDFGSIP